MAVALTAYVIGWQVTPTEATLSFYESAAQIIPVLLLVLAIEARAFEMRRMPTPPALVPGTFLDFFERSVSDEGARFYSEFMSNVLGLPVLVAIVAGEFAALHPVMTGKATDGTPGPVLGAIAAGFAMIVLLALRAPVQAAATRQRPLPETRTNRPRFMQPEPRFTV